MKLFQTFFFLLLSIVAIAQASYTVEPVTDSTFVLKSTETLENGGSNTVESAEMDSLTIIREIFSRAYQKNQRYARLEIEGRTTDIEAKRLGLLAGQFSDTTYYQYTLDVFGSAFEGDWRIRVPSDTMNVQANFNEKLIGRDLTDNSIIARFLIRSNSFLILRNLFTEDVNMYRIDSDIYLGYLPDGNRVVMRKIR